MTSPAISRWDFLFGTVLIVADGPRVMMSTGPAGVPAVLVWTSPEGAEEAAASAAGHRPAAIPTTRLLEILPDGAGITLQPGTPAALWISPEYAHRLAELGAPFPGGAELRFVDWLDIPARLVAAIREQMAGRAYVEEVRGWLYTVDDSPYQGVLAYRTDAGSEGDDGAANGLDAALSATVGGPGELGVSIVRTLRIDSLPDGVVDAVGGTEVYRR